MSKDTREVYVLFKFEFENSHLVKWEDFKDYCLYRLNLGIGSRKLVDLKDMKILDGEDLFLFKDKEGM